MPAFITSLSEALSKLTDIMNLGRLIFYTAAGLPPVVALAMIFNGLGVGTDANFWARFRTDFTWSLQQYYYIWPAALVTGFVIANLGYATTLREVAKTPHKNKPINRNGFMYQYPRLRSGHMKRSEDKDDKNSNYDYADWLVREYYRFVEIAVYLPYGVLVALPLLSLYSITRMLSAEIPQGVVSSFGGFLVWTTAATLGWTLYWPLFWVPRVIAPLFEIYRQASASLIAGFLDFAGGNASGEPPKNEETPAKESGK